MIEVLCVYAALRLTATFVPSYRQNTKDVHTLAQLISAYSLVDTDKAKSYPFPSQINRFCRFYAFLQKQKCFYKSVE